MSPAELLVQPRTLDGHAHQRVEHRPCLPLAILDAGVHVLAWCCTCALPVVGALLRHGRAGGNV